MPKGQVGQPAEPSCAAKSPCACADSCGETQKWVIMHLATAAASNRVSREGAPCATDFEHLLHLLMGLHCNGLLHRGQLILRDLRACITNGTSNAQQDKATERQDNRTQTYLDARQHPIQDRVICVADSQKSTSKDCSQALHLCQGSQHSNYSLVPTRLALNPATASANLE